MGSLRPSKRGRSRATIQDNFAARPGLEDRATRLLSSLPPRAQILLSGYLPVRVGAQNSALRGDPKQWASSGG